MRPLYRNRILWVCLFGVALLTSYFCLVFGNRSKIYTMPEKVALEDSLKRFALGDQKEITRFLDILHTTVGMEMDQARQRLSGYPGHEDQDILSSVQSRFAMTTKGCIEHRLPSKYANGSVIYSVYGKPKNPKDCCDNGKKLCIGITKIQNGKVVSVDFALL